MKLFILFLKQHRELENSARDFKFRGEIDIDNQVILADI